MILLARPRLVINWQKARPNYCITECHYNHTTELEKIEHLVTAGELLLKNKSELSARLSLQLTGFIKQQHIPSLENVKYLQEVGTD